MFAWAPPNHRPPLTCFLLLVNKLTRSIKLPHPVWVIDIYSAVVTNKFVVIFEVINNLCASVWLRLCKVAVHVYIRLMIVGGNLTTLFFLYVLQYIDVLV